MMCLPTNAQQKKDLYPELEKGEPVLIISDNTPGKETLINIFEVTESPYFHDPRAPRFLLTDQKGKFALGIGGYARTVVSYDFDGISDNVDFIPALIPQRGSMAARNQFQLDATTTMLFIKLVGHTDKLGDFVIYTAGNFRGNGRTFKLRNAYLSFLGFTMGYDTGMFMDAAAFPPCIDFQGPNGMTFYRTTQLRYEASIVDGLKMGIGIESPSVNGTPANDVAINTQRCPDIPAYMQLNWNSKSHIRLSGIYRNMSYRNNLTDKYKSLSGWGIQASTTFALGNFQVYGQYTYGKGIARYMNDMSNLNVDIVPKYGNPAEMQALPMTGWFAGLQYNFSKKVFASATYSGSYLNSRNNYSQNNQTSYRDGKYLVSNIFWNMTPDLQLGAEYLHGWRKDFNGDDSGANRINICAKYNF